jgi:hypothetical protein
MQQPDADQPTGAPDGDDFMYQFLRMEMKRQRQQRRAMRRDKESVIEIKDRFRETERYRRELDQGKLTVTPEQAKAQNVNLMPHFEGVQLRDYRRNLVCESLEESAHRRARRPTIRRGNHDAVDRIAREKASRQYRKVALNADLLVKHMQRKLEESAKRRMSSRGRGPFGEKKMEEDEDLVMPANSEDRLRDLMRQIKRDLTDITRNIDILDGQLTLFARARERLDLRYKAAVGTRPDFLNDILLMTGGKPGEPYIKSVGDLNDGDA